MTERGNLDTRCNNTKKAFTTMYKDKKILAIVPARGGSKGLPGKNIMEIFGKPAIAWTIESALKSAFLDKTIVTTDDQEIADIARKYGAVIPFIRPKELAGDKTPMIDVILHALDFFKKCGEAYDIMVLLQPTSPLRKAEDIDGSIKAMFEKGAGSVISVCETEHPPYWSNTLPPDGCMKDFVRKDIMNKNRQELPKFYRLNGAIYASDVEYLYKLNCFFGEKTFAYVMPFERSVDIDHKTDMLLSEILLRAQNG